MTKKSKEKTKFPKTPPTTPPPGTEGTVGGIESDNEPIDMDDFPDGEPDMTWDYPIH
jgi:hypothetical protein